MCGVVLYISQILNSFITAYLGRAWIGYFLQSIEVSIAKVTKNGSKPRDKPLIFTLQLRPNSRLISPSKFRFWRNLGSGDCWGCSPAVRRNCILYYSFFSHCLCFCFIGSRISDILTLTDRVNKVKENRSASSMLLTNLTFKYSTQTQILIFLEKVFFKNKY